VERPPPPESLKGEDDRRVRTLQQTIEQLKSERKFAEAIEPAREVLAIRRKALGADHWSTDDARHAVDDLERIARLPEEGRRAVSTLVSLGKKFNASKEQGRLSEAESLARSMLEICTRWLGKDHPDTARSYTRVAIVLEMHRKYVEAERLGREARAIWLKSMPNDHPDTVRLNNNLAITLHPQGKFTEAESLFRENLEILARLGQDDLMTALSLRNLAWVLMLKRRFTEAEPLLRRALKVCADRKESDSTEAALILGNLGSVLQFLGKYGEAEPLLRARIEIARRNFGDDDTITLKARWQLAENLAPQGRYAEAEPIHRRALLRHIATEGEDEDTGVLYTALAMNLYFQGKYSEARPLCERAIVVTSKARGDRSPFVAPGHELLAAILERQGNIQEAETATLKVIELGRRMPADHLQVSSHYENELAPILVAQKKYCEAEALLRKGLEIAVRTEGEDSPDTRLLSGNIARVLAMQEKYKEAETLLRELIGRMKESGRYEHPQLASVHDGLGLCLYHEGRRAEAIRNWTIAEDLYEQTRRLRSATGLERALMAGASASSQLAIALADQGRARDAWVHWEKDLARGLLDELSARQLRPLSLEERRREADLAGQLQRLDERIASLAADSVYLPRLAKQLDSLRNDRIGLQGQWVEFQNTLDNRYQAYAGKPSSLEVVQKALSSDMALVGWLDDLNSPWACIVRHSGDPVWVKIPGSGRDGAWTKDDKERPGLLREALVLNQVAWKARTGALSRHRITPLLPHLKGVKHLIVLPSPALAGVPLETLIADGPRYVISYAPSGSMLAQFSMVRSQAARSVRLLAVGDPAFSQPAQGDSALARPDPGLLGFRGEALTPLPGSRREVEAIAALFPGGEVTALLGCDATESKLQRLAETNALKDYRFLHLATHGKTNPSVALSSALFLADEGRTPPSSAEQPAPELPLDGRVTAEQIVRTWELDADLVVLSACETGLGRYAGGEGYLGFSQALFVKGARSLALSLWKVDDGATALLMTRFYQNLLGKREGLSQPMPKAAALDEAKRWLRELRADQVEGELSALSRGTERRKGPAVPRKPESPRPFEHPYYWAAFILVGNPN
jgi:CHAT domain-containing protein/tetratricopeptide (TPR) repeat protein